MADSELVSINNLKENVLEFDLTVEGLDSNSVDAKFVIRSNDMDMAFPCRRDESGKWSVKLPPLPMLERTAYPFHFQVVAEGYHFQPLKGSVNVVGSSEVYVSGAKNTKVISPAKPEVTKVRTEATVAQKSQPTKSREKPIEQIARELMEGQKAAAPKVEAKSEAKPVVESLLPTIKVEAKKESATAEKDRATRKVLEDLGFETGKAKPKKKFSLKD